MKNKKVLVLILLMFTSIAGLLTTPIFNVEKDELITAVVFFKNDVDAFEEDFSDIIGFSYRMQFMAINGFSATMSKSTFEWFESLPYVSISENKIFQVLEDELDWGVDYVEAERVWGGMEDAYDVISGNVAGQGVKVCVADTGIDYTHPDLNDNYITGYDFVNNDNDPMDVHGHGTHCAGLIAAEDNGFGVIGVAPKVSLYAAKVLNDAGTEESEQVAAGINWAVQNDMDILSMSLGVPDQTALETACDNAWAAGVILVCATGNSGNTDIGHPAIYESTIAVGALNSNYKRASFSNYGPELELVAPGVGIYSTVANGKYRDKSGTSMSAPLVSGTSALILSANPDLTNDQVRDILHDTATDLGPSGFDIEYGYGLVNAEEAVAVALGGGDDTTPPSVEIVYPSNGATVSGIVNIKAPASDNKGVSKVEFYIDDTIIGTDSSAPYEWNWDTMGFANGEYSIKARAYDHAGNTAEDSISVIIEIGDIVLIEDTFIGAVAGHEVDYYAIQALPGEMSVTASWSGNTDIDVYICTAEDYIDHLARGYTTNNPETCSYDIQTAGSYYVAVRMYTQSASSTDYTLKVKYYTSGSGEDTNPPTVNIISPADGAEVSGIVTIEFSATDASRIASREIMIDGVIVSTSNTYDWDTSDYAVGEHYIRCEATDASENANIGHAEITVAIKYTSLEDAILSISAPSEIEPTGSFDVTFSYSAKGERNIVVSLVNPNDDGSIWTSTSISVSEGEGEETVTLTHDGTTPSGTDYVIEVKMFDLSEIEVASDTTPITVKEEGQPAPLFTDIFLISIFMLGAAGSIIVIQRKSKILRID